MNIVQWLERHSFNDNPPINLDDMGVEDLKEFVEFDDEGARRQVAEVVFGLGNAKGYNIAEILFRYARCKLFAIRERLKGNINGAIGYEAYCDEYYEDLPTEAQW